VKFMRLNQWHSPYISIFAWIFNNFQVTCVRI
jgi:hypothetical protein